MGKDDSHDLGEKEWEKLPEALKRPFAITRLGDKDKGYRLYTTLKNSKGEYIVVGVDVKNSGRDIEVNAISTVFGRRESGGKTQREEVIFTDKEITPEQKSLLNEPNLRQYPTAQESILSEGNKESLLTDKQGRESESSASRLNEALDAINDEYGTHYSDIDRLVRWAARNGKGLMAIDRIAEDYLSAEDASEFKRNLRKYINELKEGKPKFQIGDNKKKGTDNSDGFAVDSTAPITPKATPDNLSSKYDKKMSPSSEMRLTGTPTKSEGPDLVPTSDKENLSEREGGQFLILSHGEGSAAALSTLPSEVSSVGKGNALSDEKQGNEDENLVKEPGFGEPAEENVAKDVLWGYKGVSRQPSLFDEEDFKPRVRFKTSLPTDSKSEPVEEKRHKGTKEVELS